MRATSSEQNRDENSLSSRHKNTFAAACCVNTFSCTHSTIKDFNGLKAVNQGEKANDAEMILTLMTR